MSASQNLALRVATCGLFLFLSFGLLAAPKTRPTTSEPPLLAFDVSDTTAAPGQSVVLSWAAMNVSKCNAAGDWGGKRDTEGFEETGPLLELREYQFRLRCGRGQNTIEALVTVAVAQPPVESPPAEDPPAEEPPAEEPPAEEPPVEEPPAEEPPPAEPVLVDLRVDDASLLAGESTNLHWSASGDPECTALGTWQGLKPATGSTMTGALLEDATFTLSCVGAGGSDSATVTVSVTNPEPPVVTLSSDRESLSAGESATLNWASERADRCEALGDWGGERPLQGTEVVADGTFQIQCSSISGTAVAMVSVQIEKLVPLQWEPPTENVDGTPVAGLSAYNVYAGTVSGDYALLASVPDGEVNGAEVAIPAGEYFFAVTAVDTQGTESAFSNEVRRLVQ